MSIDLDDDEVALIHDCIACELARVIMHPDPHNERSIRLIDLGIRFGMEL